MPSTNDNTRMYKEIRKDKQKRHRTWRIENLVVLKTSEFAGQFTVTQNDETVLFRIEGNPRVDFYPSTGRWKVITGKGTDTYMNGGARAFLSWFRKQRA